MLCGKSKEAIEAYKKALVPDHYNLGCSARSRQTHRCLLYQTGYLVTWCALNEKNKPEEAIEAFIAIKPDLCFNHGWCF